MSRDLISKATRNEFRETMVGFVLREIDMLFDAVGLKPKLGHAVNLTGARRSRVEEYYAAIDFTVPAVVGRVAEVYAEIIDSMRKRAVAGDQYAGPRADELERRMRLDGFTLSDGRFTSPKLRTTLVSAARVVEISAESIQEHLDKAQTKIDSEDYAGAITSAYTLLEDFLKALLRRTETPFKQDEGDVRALFKLVSAPLNLSPAGEHLESYLKTVLQGLSSQVAGLFEVANKAGDRHARRYNPARHHAKLVVNSVFTLCEFLLDSHQYQERRRAQASSSGSTNTPATG